MKIPPVTSKNFVNNNNSALLTTQTLVAVVPSCVVYALEALSSGPVAVAHSVRIHVAVALALLTLLGWPELAPWVTEVPISAHFTFWS